MKEQVEDDLPLPELRGMLRLKKIEIQDHLEQEDVRLARVEARLRQIEETRLKAKREGGDTMRICPRCGRRVPETEGDHCPYCGKPLTLSHAGFLPIDRPTRELALRSLGLLLGALAIVAVVAGGREAPDLTIRPPSGPTSASPRVALLSTRYSRPESQGAFIFEGQVKNVSDAPLEDTVAVVSIYDTDPGLITASRAPIDHDILSPGEVSTFAVEVDFSPQARSYGVIFQLPSGSAIPMRDDRLD